MAHTYTIEDGKATIRKKGSGEVLGQAEEDQLNDYLADLHKNGPEKMAAGGTVGGLTSDQDDQVNKWITQGMSGQAPNPFQVAQAPQDTSFSEGDTDNASAPAETPKDNEDTESKIADAHPGVRPDELAQYVKGEEAQSEAWGPDKQAALMNHLTQGYKKPGFILSEGAAGLGDAIMQGVARAGQGNALNTVERNKENQMKTAADMGEHLDESNMKHLAAKEHLEGMSSSTPLGASEVAAYLPLLKQVYPGLSEEQYQKIASNPAAVKSAIGPAAEVMKAKAQLAYEQGTREDAKVGQIAGRYNPTINKIQKDIDDLDTSLKGLKSGDLGQVASAQAIVSQALKLSPRLAKEAGGQSYAAKIDEWSSGKFANQSMPPELMKPVMRILERQRQAYSQQKNNLVEQAAAEGSAMRVDPKKIRTMFGTPGQPTSLGTGGAEGSTVTIRASDGTMHKLPAANLDKAKQRDPGLQVMS